MNTKVYYFGVDTPGDCLVKERLDERYVHSKCPVVHHKNNRVFVAHSPVNFEAKVDRNSDIQRRIMSGLSLTLTL
jgi:TFIIF-interacting CTD phosphatase-like protein